MVSLGISLPFSPGFQIVAIIFLIKKYQLFFQNNQKHRTLASQISVFIIAIPVLILFLRGLNLQGKPLGIIDAYKNQSEQQANLILNGIYTGGKGTTQIFKRTDYNFFSSEEIKHVLELCWLSASHASIIICPWRLVATLQTFANLERR